MLHNKTQQSLPLQQHLQQHPVLPQVLQRSTLPLDIIQMSACLMVKEDNHLMIEWLAYHYHVLPLRTLVVCEQQDNREYVSELLENTPWEELIDIHYVKAGVDFYNSSGEVEKMIKNKDDVYAHLAIQGSCYEHCSRFLRDSTNSSWTTFTDSDEFIVAKKNKNIHENSIAPLLTKPPYSNSNQCVFMERTMFSGNVSTVQEKDQNFATEKFNRVPCWKWVPGKSIIDVSTLRDDQIKCKNPHAGVAGNSCESAMRGDRGSITAHHYLGTREDYLSRNDNRRTPYDYDRLNKETRENCAKTNNDAFGWLDEFREKYGGDDLLFGAGKHTWGLI